MAALLFPALLFVYLQASPASYPSLLDEYVHADPDRAVAELSSWTPREVLERAPKANALRAYSPAALRAIALLHTEAMMRQASRAAVDTHRAIAYAAANALVLRAGLDPFFIGWRVVTSSYLLSVGDILNARVAPSGDAELLLLVGSIAESLASEKTQRAGEVSHTATAGSTRGDRAVLLLEAERSYSAALRADPQLVEARLRLGRVYDLEGRHDLARTELERAQRETQSAYLAYLAGLFLGRVYEDRHQSGEAARAYKTAIEHLPDAQSARLALARLAEDHADDASARAGLLSVLPADPERTDPWWVYPFAQYWQINTRVDRLREMLRK